MEHLDNRGIYRIILISMRNHKMFNFMCSLLILLILSAVLEDYTYANLILNTLTTLVIFAGGYAACTDRRSAVILLVLTLPWAFSQWFFASDKTVFFGFFFFLYVILTLFDMIIKSKDITQNILYSAVCVYLLLGILWVSLYGLINQLVPGAIFSVAHVEHAPTLNELVYFSYTTLTTLGYGDITSITPAGRIMAVLEAKIGQLFIAFLVARLIGIHSYRHARM